MTQPNENVCYTFEAALEMAVAMEEGGFRHYLEALRSCRRPETRMILKDAALDELEHKHQLEKALVEGTIDAQHFDHPVPTMDLDYLLKQKTLSPDADGREALAYAIHLEKISLDFYQRMANGCSGAPMGSIFAQIANDEAKHLRALEDDYEKHFLTEN